MPVRPQATTSATAAAPSSAPDSGVASHGRPSPALRAPPRNAMSLRCRSRTTASRSVGPLPPPDRHGLPLPPSSQAIRFQPAAASSPQPLLGRHHVRAFLLQLPPAHRGELDVHDPAAGRIRLLAPNRPRLVQPRTQAALRRPEHDPPDPPLAEELAANRVDEDIEAFAR